MRTYPTSSSKRAFRRRSPQSLSTPTRMASHRNSEILSSFDSDLGRLIEAHQHTTLDYGRHPNFAFFEKIDKNGMDYSFIRALSEEERITVNTISRTHIITWPTRPRPKHHVAHSASAEAQINNSIRRLHRTSPLCWRSTESTVLMLLLGDGYRHKQ